MKRSLILVCLISALNCFSQNLTSQELLDKAIAYHDPSGNWESFNGLLNVVMQIPDKSPRSTAIQINLPEEYFSAVAKQDTSLTTYSVTKGVCKVTVSNPNVTAPDCERALMYKDYYTYLYGLPMKLKDPGTNIAPEVLKKEFKGKDYLVLKASYDAAIGSDVWFFYFDPTSYAMEVYQFFKGDPEGEGANTGEYILLTDEAIINGIKMPKVRAWYYNKDDAYLGTDTLNK